MNKKELKQEINEYLWKEMGIDFINPPKAESFRIKPDILKKTIEKTIEISRQDVLKEVEEIVNTWSQGLGVKKCILYDILMRGLEDLKQGVEK